MSNHVEWDPTCKVFLGGLRKNADKDEIKDIFREFGRVLKIWIAQRPPGFGFVLMSSARDAEDAVKSLHGTKMSGNRVIVEMTNKRTKQVEVRRERYKSSARDSQRRRSRSRSSESRGIKNRRRRRKSTSESDIRDRSSSGEKVLSVRKPAEDEVEREGFKLFK
eukprot:TRINITY_DN76652_c0_g1_i1.p1 TRINITY_DN76652_c0_g1~~TRINITY_DN76652_c0_g1_i1.p1  ORF type:complete len:164 (-),score=55.45 TRINITY_DN76652_c0_g1_i1:24-515(-)